MDDSNSKYTSSVVELLEIVNYGKITSDHEWNRNMIFTSCQSRIDLLHWILEQFQTNQNRSWLNRSLKEQMKELSEAYSALGFCKLSETNLFDGGATIHRQSEFFKRILTHLEHYQKSKTISNRDNTKVNHLIYNITKNTPIGNLLKTEEVNFLPAHLYSKYKKQQKQEKIPSIEQRIQDGARILDCLIGEKETDQATICYKTDICQDIDALTESSAALATIFKTQIEPWIKQEDLTTVLDNTTGLLVQKNDQSVQTVLELAERKKLVEESYKSLQTENTQADCGISTKDILLSITSSMD